MRLSNDSIVKMKYRKTGNKQDIRWDDLVQNFGVRVYPTNSKSYVIGYRLHGKRKIAVIASVKNMDLSTARVKALDLLDKIQRTGKPIAIDKGLTINKLCGIYIERRAKGMRSAVDEIRRINRHIVSRWGMAKVVAVTVADLRTAHEEITKVGQIEANRVIQTYRRIINRGKEWNLIPREFLNPAEEITQHPERKRDRWVNPEEMPKLLRAINRVENRYVRAAFWLYLLTGTRRQELLAARREHFDQHVGTLRLVETKTGREQYLQLSEAAKEILTSLPEVSENPFLFPGRVKGKHLVEVSKSWQRVRADAGLEDVTIHDLRRTLGSWLAQDGKSLHLIGEVLGHKDASSTEIYARFGQSHLKNALEDFADELIEKSDIKPKLEYVFTVN